MDRQRFLCFLLCAKGAAFGAAFRGNLATAAAHAYCCSLALAAVVIGAMLCAAINAALNRGVSSADIVFACALAALLVRVAAGLAALLGGGSVHLNTRQAALVVAIMLAGGNLTFQSVHKKAPRLYKFAKLRFTTLILPRMSAPYSFHFSFLAPAPVKLNICLPAICIITNAATVVIIISGIM